MQETTACGDVAWFKVVHEGKLTNDVPALGLALQQNAKAASQCPAIPITQHEADLESEPEPSVRAEWPCADSCWWLH